PANPRLCGTYSDQSAVLQSENFPLLYPANTDCEYRIMRHGPQVCQLELNMVHFDLASDNRAACDRDYLEVKGTRYCGNRDGQRGDKYRFVLKTNEDFQFWHFLRTLPFTA
ncbi:hypothetical protein JTE90_013049, partial [Oedothorax gibbosus]